MANILDGKKISAQVLEWVKAETGKLAQKGIIPGLATVLVGDDPASHVYVGQKIKKSEACGQKPFPRPFPATVSQAELLSVVQELNNDPQVHSILVQLPLPKHLDPEPIILAIDPKKDADGLHPLNQGLVGRLKSWKEIVVLL